MSDDFPSQKSPWRVQGVSSPPCLITMKGIIMDQHTQQVLSSNGPIAWPDCDPGRLDIWPAQLGFKGLVARTIREFKPFMCMYLYIYTYVCIYIFNHKQICWANGLSQNDALHRPCFTALGKWGWNRRLLKMFRSFMRYFRQHHLPVLLNPIVLSSSSHKYQLCNQNAGNNKKNNRTDLGTENWKIHCKLYKSL